MPISFQDDESVQKLGFAAFLHVELKQNAAYGALLFLNARGEPQEFVFNRLEMLNSVLWRTPDLAAGATRRLCASLFPTATLTPQLLLFLPNVIPPQLFGGDGGISLNVPAGAIWSSHSNEPGSIETFDSEGEVSWVHVDWSPHPPVGELFVLLARRGLLLEPFGRAAAGLHEVYSDTEF